ncbi:AlpA family phage regulatory protein [Brevundimonas sp.]|uniref:helix-turn-helix transcriptional regulator n=1 Tax=Brevundimonas sp. TaxID=1871086 RepID=UPI001D3CBABB|nr:AlpA family phage regulatory protein [Brevundimonas sp.]MBA3999374.1 hypothetical protein [Brevundimonas sp.]
MKVATQASPPEPYADRLIQVREVTKLTSLSRTQIHRLCKEPEYAHLNFPQPVRIGAQRMAWSLPAVRQWIADRLTLAEREAQPQTDEVAASE